MRSGRNAWSVRLLIAAWSVWAWSGRGSANVVRSATAGMGTSVPDHVAGPKGGMYEVTQVVDSEMVWKAGVSGMQRSRLDRGRCCQGGLYILVARTSHLRRKHLYCTH